MDFRGSKSVFSKKTGIFVGGLGRSKKRSLFLGLQSDMSKCRDSWAPSWSTKNNRKWRKLKKRGFINFRHSLLFFLDRIGCGCNDVEENAVKNKVLATSRGRISAKMDMFSKTGCFFGSLEGTTKNTFLTARSNKQKRRKGYKRSCRVRCSLGF